MENKTYDLVITKKHCEGTNFLSNKNCAVCKAVREQTDLDGDFNTGTYSMSIWNGGSRHVYAFDRDFGRKQFQELLDGEIVSFNLKITEQKLNSEQNVQVSDTTKSEQGNVLPKPKEVHHYYRIPNDVMEELKKMSVPEILDSN